MKGVACTIDKQKITVESSIASLTNNNNNYCCCCYYYLSLSLFSSIFLSWCYFLQTRTPNFPNPEQLRKEADKFLVHSLHSDVSFLYSPSQVTLYLITNYPFLELVVHLFIYMINMKLSLSECVCGCIFVCVYAFVCLFVCLFACCDR